MTDTPVARQRFQIAFGAFSDTIASQLRKGRISGWKVKDARRWQHVADAITTCFLHHVITRAQAGFSAAAAGEDHREGAIQWPMSTYLQMRTTPCGRQA